MGHINILSVPSEDVPSLKGPRFIYDAYPALTSWATIVTPFGLGIDARKKEGSGRAFIGFHRNAPPNQKKIEWGTLGLIRSVRRVGHPPSESEGRNKRSPGRKSWVSSMECDESGRTAHGSSASCSTPSI